MIRVWKVSRRHRRLIFPASSPSILDDAPGIAFVRQLRCQKNHLAEPRSDLLHTNHAWNRNFIPYWLLIPQGVAKALRRAAGKEPFRQVGRHGLLALGAAVNVFECAEKHGVASLSIPLLGAGTGGVAPRSSLAIISEAWRQSAARLDTEVWVYDHALFRRLQQMDDACP